MIIIITILSFILEFLLNSFLYKTVLIPLFVICTLILVEPFFYKAKTKYLVYAFIIGLLYDMIFTGTYFMSAGIFLLIATLIMLINKLTPNNFLITIIEIIIFICIYRIISFLLLALFQVIPFEIIILKKSIISSLSLNTIYSIILYIIMYFISKKFNIIRIN